MTGLRIKPFLRVICEGRGPKGPQDIDLVWICQLRLLYQFVFLSTLTQQLLKFVFKYYFCNRLNLSTCC